MRKINHKNSQRWGRLRKGALSFRKGTQRVWLSTFSEHIANMESVLFIHEGSCILHIHDEEKVLEKGNAFIVPPNVKHQIKAKTDFKSIHFMPKEIKFEFFK